MFIALREIRTARGRFGLMVAVVTMITVLLVVLTALTAGLGRQSTSAVEALPTPRVALAAPTYADSVITAAQVQAMRDAGAQVEPLGIGHLRLTHGQAAATAAVFGVAPGSEVAQVTAGRLVLPRGLATDLGVAAGDSVVVERRTLRVDRLVDTAWYSHSPVVYTDAATHAALTHAPSGQVGSVLLVHTPPTHDVAGLTVHTRADSLAALPGYTSEHSSLLLIQAFLYGISALVVVAFVSVWTIQRTRDLAVVRALGGSRGYVLRDALGQAVIVLAVGTLLGAAIGAGLILGIGSAAPVLAGLTTFALPVGGVAALGLAGSYLATRRVTRVDPLLALGGN